MGQLLENLRSPWFTGPIFLAHLAGTMSSPRAGVLASAHAVAAGAAVAGRAQSTSLYNLGY